jgi:hypothetical protein
MIGQSNSGVRVRIKINDKDLPPANDFFHSFYIYYGFGYKVPTLSLTVIDKNKLLTGPFSLVDGSKITLIYGVSSKPDRELSFSLISAKPTQSDSGVIFNIIAVMGKPNYIFGAQQESKRGTSVNAIKQIVEASGMVYDGDVQTDDSMTWLNVGKSRMLWIQDILAKSYKDDNSLVVGMQDLDNTFKVREMFELAQSKEQYEVFIGDFPQKKFKVNEFFASQYKPFNYSGISNLLFNYGHVRTQQKIDGTIDKYDTVNPPVLGDGLSINQSIRDSFTYSSSRTSKYYDSGISEKLNGSNAHKKYYEAAVLNNRYLTLFNSGIQINIMGQVEIPLFSVIKVNAVNQYQTLETQENLNGNYIIGSGIVACVGKEYREFYSLYRHYVNESGNTPLLGSKNADPNSKKPAMEKANSVVDYSDPVKDQSLSKQAASLASGVNNAAQNLVQGQDNIKSGFDKFIDTAMQQISDLEKSFEAESSSFGFAELAAKYTAGKDQLMNLLNEFSFAKSILENCGKLNPLESLVIDLVKLNLNGLVDLIVDRIGRVEGLQAKLLNEINSLLALGDLNGGYLSAPQLNVSCRTFAQDHLNAALRDLYPDQCIDNFNMNRLRFPFNKLTRLRRLLMSLLRDLLCALGENSEI